MSTQVAGCVLSSPLAAEGSLWVLSPAPEAHGTPPRWPALVFLPFSFCFVTRVKACGVVLLRDGPAAHTLLAERGGAGGRVAESDPYPVVFVQLSNLNVK